MYLPFRCMYRPDLCAVLKYVGCLAVTDWLGRKVIWSYRFATAPPRLPELTVEAIIQTDVTFKDRSSYGRINRQCALCMENCTQHILCMQCTLISTKYTLLYIFDWLIIILGMACFTYNSVFALSGPPTVANLSINRRSMQVRGSRVKQILGLALAWSKYWDWLKQSMAVSACHNATYVFTTVLFCFQFIWVFFRWSEI